MHAPTGDQILNPGLCPDWELNRRPFPLSNNAQPTEQHQSGYVPGFVKFN